MQKIIVYTCVTGNYDVVLPQPDDPRVSYMLFSDGSPVQGWEHVPIAPGDVRAARHVKILPHEHLPAHDASIYIDGCMRFVRPPADLLQIARGNIAICAHPHDRDAFDHAATLERCTRLNGTIDEVRHQIEQYEAAQMPREMGLYETSLVVRRPTEATTRLCDAWWDELSQYSSRDQIALYAACCRTGIWPTVLPFKSRTNAWVHGWGHHRINPITSTKSPAPACDTIVPDMPTVLRGTPGRVAVATVAIGHDDLYSMTLPTLRAFAERFGYSFHVIDDLGTHRHPAWAKLECGRVMDETGCDTLLFIDADVLIPPWATSPIPYTPPVGCAAMNSAYWLPGCQHWPTWRRETYLSRWTVAATLTFPRDRYINSGVFIVNKDARGLFDAPPAEKNDGRMYEQTWLNCQAGRFPYHNLSRLWNWGHLDTADHLSLAMHDSNIQFVHLSGTADKRAGAAKILKAWRVLAPDLITC